MLWRLEFWPRTKFRWDLKSLLPFCQIKNCSDWQEMRRVPTNDFQCPELTGSNWIHLYPSSNFLFSSLSYGLVWNPGTHERLGELCEIGFVSCAQWHLCLALDHFLSSTFSVPSEDLTTPYTPECPQCLTSGGASVTGFPARISYR